MAPNGAIFVFSRQKRRQKRVARPSPCHSVESVSFIICNLATWEELVARDRALFDMWPPFRDRLIEELDFYYAQSDKRLMSQFDNISEEADAHAEERTILSVISGMYFEFEKQLREFVIREIMKAYATRSHEDKLWQLEITKFFDLIEGLGWPIRTLPSFDDLDTGRLVVNVFKHGNGKSLRELKRKSPHHLRSVFGHHELARIIDSQNHTHLTVEREDVERFYKAIRSFWELMPLRVKFSDAKTAPEWFIKLVNAPDNDDIPLTWQQLLEAASSDQPTV
eukprot:gene41154-55644_t